MAFCLKITFENLSIYLKNALFIKINEFISSNAKLAMKLFALKFIK